MRTFNEDGNAHWPSLPDLAKVKQHPQMRKILVSQEFPMMADMIQLVPFLYLIFSAQVSYVYYKILLSQPWNGTMGH